MSASKWWENTFVLSSFTSIRKGDDVESIVELLHEAGLNTLECNTPLEYSADDATTDEIIRALVACEKHGMRFIVTDHKRFTGVAEPNPDTLQSVVDDYSSYPALGGYYVWDEPHPESFAAVRMMRETFNALDPDRLVVNAMVPSYGHFTWPDAYPEFAKGFASAVDPQVYSFDYYGVHTDPDNPDGPPIVAQELFADLGLWSQISKRTGKPLWYYPSCCQWGGVAKPTRATLSFQVYTAIAYGAKGIQYFECRGFEGGAINFINAQINSDGTKGPTFDIFRELNAEINALAPTLADLTLVQLIHTEPPHARNITQLAPDCTLMTASENLIISVHLTSDFGKRYLVVVNKDMNAPRLVSLRFLGLPATLVELPATTELSGNKIEFEMEPGGGKVFELK